MGRRKDGQAGSPTVKGWCGGEALWYQCRQAAGVRRDGSLKLGGVMGLAGNAEW